MRKLFFLLVLVGFSGLSVAETQNGDHLSKANTQSNPVYPAYQGRAVKKDANVRLFELVNACLNDRSGIKRDSVLNER